MSKKPKMDRKLKKGWALLEILKISGSTKRDFLVAAPNLFGNIVAVDGKDINKELKKFNKSAIESYNFFKEVLQRKEEEKE